MRPRVASHLESALSEYAQYGLRASPPAGVPTRLPHSKPAKPTSSAPIPLHSLGTRSAAHPAQRVVFISPGQTAAVPPPTSSTTPSVPHSPSFRFPPLLPHQVYLGGRGRAVRRAAAYGSSSKAKAGSGPAARRWAAGVFASRDERLRDEQIETNTLRRTPQTRRPRTPSAGCRMVAGQSTRRFAAGRPSAARGVTDRRPRGDLLGKSGSRRSAASRAMADASRRSRDYLLNSARVGDAVTEGEPRSG